MCYISGRHFMSSSRKRKVRRTIDGNVNGNINTSGVGKIHIIKKLLHIFIQIKKKLKIRKHQPFRKNCCTKSSKMKTSKILY